MEIKIKGEAESKVGTLKWTSTAEFDGMVRYDLSLVPSPETVVDSLEITFSLKQEYAKFCYLAFGYPPYPEIVTRLYGSAPTKNYVGDLGTYRGKIPVQEGETLNGNALLYWWFGDEEKGLAGFCETDQAWANVDNGDGFRIEREDGIIKVTWVFSKTRWKLPKEWKFTFGLQATPVKRKVNWRKYRVTRTPGPNWALCKGEIRGANATIIWPHKKNFPYVPYAGYADSTRPEEYKKGVEELHRKGIKAIPYSILTYLDPNAPEAFYLEEWKNGAIDNSWTHRIALYRIYPTSDCIDWLVWQNYHYVRKFNVDGLYHDTTGVYPSIYHGYSRNGKTRARYPFFGTRELYKRIYTMLKEYGKEQGKDTISISHMSPHMNVPVLTFTDIYLDAEHFAAAVRKSESYSEVITEDWIKAEMMGHNYGIIPMILPEAMTIEDQKRLTPSLLALSLLYDFNLWNVRADFGQLNEVYKVFDEYGIETAEFIGPWKSKEIIKNQTEKLKVSLYKTSEGYLLCAANLTKIRKEPEFLVDWEKLGLKDIKVKDTMTGEKVEVKGNILKIAISPYNYRLLWIE